MAFPLIPVLAALGTTALAQIQQAQQNKRDRELAGEITRYSPWTGLKADPIRKVDTLGNLMKGVQTGVFASTIGDIGSSAANSGANSVLSRASHYSPLGVNYDVLTPDMSDVAKLLKLSPWQRMLAVNE
jgi:hypothetical protein